GEARRRPERVAGEDHDVRSRLDVGEGGERDSAGDRERGQRGDEGDDLRGRPRALIPGEARDQDGAEDQEAGELPAHLSPSAESGAAPCSGVTIPGRSRIRATSVAKYQPPESASPLPASAIATPSPSRTTRSAKLAANSTSWVATTTPAPAAARRPI